MELSVRYVLRFFLWSIVLFGVYQLLAPLYTSLLVAPLTALLSPLQALQRGTVVQFEWLARGRVFRFTEVHFHSLGHNLIILSALLLALRWPLRRRLRVLFQALVLLSLFNVGHLGVILLHDYHQGRGAPPAGTGGTVFWATVRIAYHLGKQVGTMVLPFVVFLAFTLRQRVRGGDGTSPGAMAAGGLSSPRRGSLPGSG